MKKRDLGKNQAIIDTLEDLARLKEFHPIQYPNRLKCAAYLAYWWLQRQPLLFSVSEEKQEEFLKSASKEDISRLIHTNAFWLVAYVFGELFTADEMGKGLLHRQMNHLMEQRAVFISKNRKAGSEEEPAVCYADSMLHYLKIIIMVCIKKKRLLVFFQQTLSRLDT